MEDGTIQRGGRWMQYMDFSLEEYRGRYARLQRLLRDANLDAVLLSDTGNLIYVTGYRSLLVVSKFRPFLSLCPAEGDPVLILPNLEVGVGRRMSWIQDVRGWGARGPYTDRPDFLSIIKDLIAEKRLNGKRIGFELSAGQRLGMTLDQFEAIRDAFAEVNCQVASCTDVMWKLRVKKSPDEIECLRIAGRATDAGYLAALEIAREGVTEREMSHAIAQGMMRAGADWPGMLIVQSGRDRYDMTNPPASERKVQRGDMVIFDIGAMYKGYWGDMTRGFFVGEASKRQREFYAAILEIFNRTKDAVKPGILIEEIDKVAEKATVDLGYKDYMWHRTGHALGVDVHELPSVAQGDKTVLEPGMVFTIEPGIYDFEVGAFRIEDVVVVTDTGHESLNATAPTELIVK
jgi:Xaa-Pro dipeptidase